MSERVGTPEGVGEEGRVQSRVLLIKYFRIELILKEVLYKKRHYLVLQGVDLIQDMLHVLRVVLELLKDEQDDMQLDGVRVFARQDLKEVS